jgi:hypothetical protein
MFENFVHLRTLAEASGRAVSGLLSLVALVLVGVGGGLNVLLITHPIAEPV